MKKGLYLFPILLALTGCSLFGSKKTEGKLNTVSNLTFTSTDGEVSWDAVNDAKEYEYTVNEQNILKTSQTSINIFDIVNDISATSLKVRAKNGDKVSDYVSLSFQTKKLATPSKGIVSYDETTHEPQITWEKVSEASKYLVSVNDKKFVSYSTNVYKPTTEGSFYLKVKCKAYVKDKSIVYLESNESEKSEVLNFIPGPTLSVDALNVISWSSSSTYDSFNLWVDGVKVRENVTSPLDLVTGENPILTKTGEYSLQIEARKDGQSYWSNVQDEVGTSNINQNEIYSFDNRKFNKVVPSGIDPGWTITNEQSHSAPYSLLISTQTQVNVQKYAASGINDVDYRRVNKISYWAYIPEIDGYSGSTISGVNLPPIIYDGWGESAAHARCVSYAKETSVPIGEWTQLHFEVENQYDHIIILGKGAELTLDDGSTTVSVRFYLDDLCYDDVEDDSLVYDYRFKYDWDLCSHSWTNQPQKLSFGSAYANKNVDITMDICGTASASGDHVLGFGAFKGESIKDLTGLYYELDRSLISSLEYHTISFNVNLDENGDFLTAAYEGHATNESHESFIIYAKNVTCTETKYSGGTYVNKHLNANNTYVSVLAIPSTLEAGSAVEVSMDVAVRTTGDYSELRTAGLLWSNNTPNYTKILGNTELKSSDDWRTVSFITRVLDASEINFHDGSAGYTQEFSGNYILVYLHGHLAQDMFFYKESTVNITMVNAMTLAGDNNNGADIYYQSVSVLESSLEVGANVTVEMDVRVFGQYNEYCDVYAVESVYTKDGGERKDATNIKTQVYNGETGWHHISFETKIKNFNVLRNGSQYQTYDMSGYGNGVYLLATSKTHESFAYKNVSVTFNNYSTISGGANTSGNGYYQSMTGLPTSFEVGTEVKVSMDIKITGTFDSYSNIYWVDQVWTTSGGESDKARTSITSLLDVNDTTNWQHVEFTANVRNFPVLRFNSGQYNTTDTSEFGNAVYLIAQNKSAESFAYKNVSLTIVSV